MCKNIPDGMLIFFPSYDMMTDLIKFWGKKEIMSKIEEQKRVCVEPRTKDKFHNENKMYYENVRVKRGAVFMAVLRGKLSEGIDFSDMYGRAVVLIGIPFAPPNDPRVKLKRQYLDEQENSQMFSGSTWYALDAIRATNQAIGRVIRHKNDYGAILLCDGRFNENKNRSNISVWIQRRLQKQKSYSFNKIIDEIATFFEKAAVRVLLYFY